MKNWYALKDDAEQAVLTIFDEIGAYGVSAKHFLNDLRGSKAKAVSLEINSPGGDVFAGIAIYNGLRASGKTINVKVMGIAASAASLIAMAGDTIEMPENSMMMIHNPWTFAVGNADEMRETADVLDKIGASLVATYAKRTGKSEDDIKKMLAEDTWMTAQEAVDNGFATKVTESFAAKASFDVDRLPENVRALFKASQPPAEPVEEPAAQTVVVDEPAVEEPAFEPAATLAEQVSAVAEAAGLQAYAGIWAADPKLADIDAVKARAQTALEIKSLFATAGKPDEADKFIRAGKTLVEAREALFAALDATAEISTAPKAANSKPTAGAQPSAVSSTAIWAARRKQTAK